MKKIIHWFINRMVVKNGTPVSLLFLVLCSSSSNIQYQEARWYFTDIQEKIRNLTYSLILSFLVLIVCSNLPGSSMCKVPSIMITNLYWSTWIQNKKVMQPKKSEICPWYWQQDPWIYVDFQYNCKKRSNLVPWLAPTATSTILLLSQVMGTAPGQDVFRYGSGGG